MPELPPRLRVGERLTARWLNGLLDYLRSRDLRAGPGISLVRTQGGTVASCRDEIGRAAARSSAPSSEDVFVGTIVAVAGTGVKRSFTVEVAGPDGQVERLKAHAANLALDPGRMDLDDSEQDPSSLFIGRRVVVHRVLRQVVNVDETGV